MSSCVCMCICLLENEVRFDMDNTWLNLRLWTFICKCIHHVHAARLKCIHHVHADWLKSRFRVGYKEKPMFYADSRSFQHSTEGMSAGVEGGAVVEGGAGVYKPMGNARFESCRRRLLWEAAMALHPNVQKNLYSSTTISMCILTMFTKLPEHWRSINNFTAHIPLFACTHYRYESVLHDTARFTADSAGMILIIKYIIV